jgi:A/G-specific adenine glycosylase
VSLGDTMRAGEHRRFSRALRAWFRKHGRALPWRNTRDPYRVLVSEAMLQQTQVSRVIHYYDRFLDRFPTIDALAKARPRQVRESWEGLGYYARAKNLHALARRVDGELPSEPEKLRTLPGVGPYTAGAVASFAFEQRAALVDTNVARVLRRAFAPRADFKTSRGQKRIWAIAQAILPRTGRATWTHNQALMELGALVCTARIAKCGDCPVQKLCLTGSRTT